MTKILLSIKPKYAEKIFSGEKVWEYRRVIWARYRINEVVVYASSPISKVVGSFDVSRVTINYLDDLWRLTSKGGCISKKEFYEYFSGLKIGNAIKIINAFNFEPRPLSDYGLKRPPQNFMYLKNEPALSANTKKEPTNERS